MELVLERGDLLQLEPFSYKGTVTLLPPGKKLKQKLIAGDDSGTLSCYEFKKGEPQNVFQVKPFEGPITSVALGGTSQKRDKRIVGYTKKGKDFFKLTSSLTETILNITVDDTKIWTGCEYIYNLYDNGQDTAFYMCRHQINSLIVERITTDHEFDVLLGCQDSCIRFIQGSQLGREVPVAAPVTSIRSMRNPEQVKQGYIGIVYGTETGALGLIDMGKTNSKNQWLIQDGPEKSSVNSIFVHDLLKDGTNTIMIGRNDGRLEVYVPNTEPNSDSDAPVKAFTRDVGESIRALECGAVNNPDNNEVVVAGYSGKIVSYTTEQVLKRAVDDKHGRSTHSVNTENRMKILKLEIDGIKQKVDKEKEKLRKTQGAEPPIAPPTDFSINASFVLDAELAAYVLIVEIQ
eukprot:gene2961-5812_t